MRTELKNLEKALRDADEVRFASAAYDAYQGPDEKMHEFLMSNDLWGGAGSVADQAGVGSTGSAQRKAIEAALISLGKAQIENEIVNIRTVGWVRAFESWKGSNI